MKAIGFKTSHEINHINSLIEFNFEKKMPENFDILVKVNAVSINPIDIKTRKSLPKNTTLEIPKILGYDGIGIVSNIGSKVKNIKVGDRVYYAGDITMPGSNSEFQIVDSRIVAIAPNTLSDAQAVVLPLTSITAWEAMFDRMNIKSNENKTILIIGGAGGVGSIAIQLAKKITNLTVIATASRKETTERAQNMGADFVVNHFDLINSINNLGFNNVDYIFNVSDTHMHWDAMAELIVPQGIICTIVDATKNVDINKLKLKSVTLVWECMFTRTIFDISQKEKHHDILTKITSLVDKGKLKTTLAKKILGFNVKNFKDAHQLIESGTTLGKIAIVY